MKNIVVTGASTGIGLTLCKMLIGKGYRVFGSVRNAGDANRLRGDLGPSFEPLLFDVTDEQAIHAEAARVKKMLGNGNLAGLVNNAGIAVAGPLEHLPLEDFRRQFEINVIGQLAVIQAFLPLLEATSPDAKPGRIINITSISGLFAAPFIGPYAASKFAMEALSDSLRRELLVKGIKVVSVAPGSVKTPIWDKAEEEEVGPYKDTPYFRSLMKFRNYALKEASSGMEPERIAQTILTALTKRNPKARYIVSKMHFLEAWLLPHLPKKTTDMILRLTFGLRPNK